MGVTKLIYCIRIYNYLRDNPNRRFTVRWIADKFDLNERTTRRYLSYLLKVDVNILVFVGRNGGYLYANRSYKG